MSETRVRGDAALTTMGEDGIANPVFHHVNLKTTRIDELIEWYGVVVGMRPNFRSDVAAFLTNDHANHRIALLAPPGLVDDPDKVKHTGMHHSAFEFRSLEDLLGRYSTLKALGVTPHGCVDHGLTTSFYYVDPDGNSVELQADNFGDWSQSGEWIRTSEDFRADPIGQLVDPDLLVAASAAGLTAEEIHERAYAGGYAATGPVDLRLPAE
jgi:catechol 2,3-dioxygenase